MTIGWTAKTKQGPMRGQYVCCRLIFEKRDEKQAAFCFVVFQAAQNRHKRYMIRKLVYKTFFVVLLYLYETDHTHTHTVELELEILHIAFKVKVKVLS